MRVLAVILAVATITSCGSVARSGAPNAAQLTADLSGSPPLLASLHRQSDRLLSGGKRAFEARLRALRGLIKAMGS